MSPVKHELRFYIPEDGILHSHRRENLKSYNFRVNMSENKEARNENKMTEGLSGHFRLPISSPAALANRPRVAVYRNCLLQFTCVL
jgi:hypothetical protein